MTPTDQDPKVQHRFRWLPIAARHYHLHKEQGTPIRTIARNLGCHASTVSRQVKRIERMQNDPAVKATLNKLRQVQSLQSSQVPNKPKPETEESRIVRLLQAKGAVLVLAENMQKALIVTDEETQSAIPIGSVSAEVGQALAMQGVLKCVSKGRLSRFILASKTVKDIGHKDLPKRIPQLNESLNAADTDQRKSSFLVRLKPHLRFWHAAVTNQVKPFCALRLWLPVRGYGKISKLAGLHAAIMAHGTSAFLRLRQRRHCPKIQGNVRPSRVSRQRCVNWGPD